MSSCDCASWYGGNHEGLYPYLARYFVESACVSQLISHLVWHCCAWLSVCFMPFLLSVVVRERISNASAFYGVGFPDIVV